MGAKELIIQELKRHGNISRAARAAGYHRTTIIKWSKTDPEFGELWRKALIGGRP